MRPEREKLEGGEGDGKGRKRRKGDEASGPPDATSILLYFPTQRSTLLNDPFAHSSTTTTFSAFKLHKYVIYIIVDIYVNFHAV